MKCFNNLQLWVIGLLLYLPGVVALGQSQPELIIPENMAKLHAAMPDTRYRLLGANVPGMIFYPAESVVLQLALTKGRDLGVVRDYALEIQEITTRDPASRVHHATAFYNSVPVIALAGQPVRHVFTVTFTDAEETMVTLERVPLPARFGTYALILTRGNDDTALRQFLGTACRVPQRRTTGTMDNVPIAGDSFLFDRIEKYQDRAMQYARMGIRGWRSELHFSDPPEGYDWKLLDEMFAAGQAQGLQVMATLSGHQPDVMPFSEPIPAIGWTPTSGGYGATGDWLCHPRDYPRFGRWVRAIAERYSRGKGLWGVENYNEPWDAGGISGWARDLKEYRALQKIIAENARSADPTLKICAASSIMNTEDKFFSDNSREYDQYVDVFTDHYVTPPMSYGPMVAASHGKYSVESETWMVNSEDQLPQIVQFLACGQRRIIPYHPQSLFDPVPGVDNRYHIPTPTVAATAAFNYFTTGKSFEKMPFLTHLPYIFQFGKDTEKDAVLILLGQIMPLAGSPEKDALWPQVNAEPTGSITINNADRLLRFFDLAGNPVAIKMKQVTLPLSSVPTYIQCAKGPRAAIERLRSARIAGRRPVEILPRDFTSRLTDAKELVIDIHNCLNCTITGTLTVSTKAAFTLPSPAVKIILAAGDTSTINMPLLPMDAKALPADVLPLYGNAVPFVFTFTSDAGKAEYAEILHAAVAPKKTIAIDGNMEDWKDVPGVIINGTNVRVDPEELARRPWLTAAANPTATIAEIKLAWDADYLYIAGRVQDPTDDWKGSMRLAGMDENQFFHSVVSDTIEPYKSFIEKERKLKNNPNLTFADYSFVWAKSPWPHYAWNRDRLQFAIDTDKPVRSQADSPAANWHDLAPDTTKVPYRFHAVPDSDYEYSLYLTSDGQGELWRLLAPGVPRVHDIPRAPKAPKHTGVVPDAKYVVKRDGNSYLYEAAIPASEINSLTLSEGTNFGFTWMAGNMNGASAEYGWDKAVTKTNGLSLHPYWSRKPSAGVRWTLIE